MAIDWSEDGIESKILRSLVAQWLGNDNVLANVSKRQPWITLVVDLCVSPFFIFFYGCRILTKFGIVIIKWTKNMIKSLKKNTFYCLMMPSISLYKVAKIVHINILILDRFPEWYARICQKWQVVTIIVNGNIIIIIVNTRATSTRTTTIILFKNIWWRVNRSSQKRGFFSSTIGVKIVLFGNPILRSSPCFEQERSPKIAVVLLTIEVKQTSFNDTKVSLLVSVQLKSEFEGTVALQKDDQVLESLVWLWSFESFPCTVCTCTCCM